WFRTRTGCRRCLPLHRRWHQCCKTSVCPAGVCLTKRIMIWQEHSFPWCPSFLCGVSVTVFLDGERFHTGHLKPVPLPLPREMISVAEEPRAQTRRCPFSVGRGCWHRYTSCVRPCNGPWLCSVAVSHRVLGDSKYIQFPD